LKIRVSVVRFRPWAPLKTIADQWFGWLRVHRISKFHVAPAWKTILRPYLTALDNGGLEELRELAGIAGIDLPDGAEITGIILRRYPTLNIKQAAEDLRRGGSA
jgi:hypothetical protein